MLSLGENAKFRNDYGILEQVFVKWQLFGNFCALKKTLPNIHMTLKN